LTTGVCPATVGATKPTTGETMTLLEPLPALPTVETPPVLPQPAPDRPVPTALADPWHAHSNRCYWDFRECRWVCAS
jgi:hypothetical protein